MTGNQLADPTGPDPALAAGILAAAAELAGPPSQPADPAWTAEVIRQAYQAGASLVQARLAADQRGTLHAAVTRAIAEAEDYPDHVAAMAVTDAVEPLIAELVDAARAEERAAERGRLADLFLLHRETLAGFAGDNDDLMRLLAHLLRLRQEVGR